MPARYRVVSFPVPGLFECSDCAALVADRQLHDTAVHSDWAGIATDDGPPATVSNQQYDGHPGTYQGRPHVYRDPTTPKETP